MSSPINLLFFYFWCIFPVIATPEIVKEPGPGSGQLKILKVGDTLYLGVEARCSPGPLVYRWFCNRVPLLEAKTPNLIIRNVTIAHKGGSYPRGGGDVS